MKRYLHLIRLFWSTAIAAELEYRLNFVIAGFSSLANLAGSLFGLFLFYRTGYQFEGWSWPEAMIVLGIFTLLQGISATFLVPNLNRIVEQVEQGTLDFVLLKPISSQFWLSTRTLSPWGFPDLVFGVIIIVYAGIQLNLTLKSYLLGIVPIVLGTIILYSLWFMLGATSIWFVKIYNVTEVLRGFLEAGRYPIVAYPAIYRVFFTFIIPVAFLTTIPAQVMLNKSHLFGILGAAILAVSLLFISIFFWKFALRFYTSASS
ncbi:ABC transporter permease [Aphanothece hegewaldii CCALA 016]|uniref:ABC transporter permease n=1 Tax=Aphanothece hegewaldii CCALA 016 TaxID=2107694 RepID=A0A2T1M1H0_9CHRO|nr:ABC transporter permease [Aphanothece hegewaldii]PSF38522.1 ABC transporter permease [Aphanothece hegewaldii CCALA 016]